MPWWRMKGVQIVQVTDKGGKARKVRKIEIEEVARELKFDQVTDRLITFIILYALKIELILL